MLILKLAWGIFQVACGVVLGFALIFLALYVVGNVYDWNKRRKIKS